MKCIPMGATPFSQAPCPAVPQILISARFSATTALSELCLPGPQEEKCSPKHLVQPRVCIHSRRYFLSYRLLICLPIFMLVPLLFTCHSEVEAISLKCELGDAFPFLKAFDASQLFKFKSKFLQMGCMVLSECTSLAPFKHRPPLVSLPLSCQRCLLGAYAHYISRPWNSLFSRVTSSGLNSSITFRKRLPWPLDKIRSY